MKICPCIFSYKLISYKTHLADGGRIDDDLFEFGQIIVLVNLSPDNNGDRQRKAKEFIRFIAGKIKESEK